MYKILIISPTPTHPQNAGNRSRIFAICEYIKNKGHDLSFFYINKEKGDSIAMINYFGDSNYFEYFAEPDTKLTSNKLNVIQRFIIKANFFKRKLFNRFIKESLDIKYNRKIDDYYDFNIDIFIKENLLENSYSHVIVEYVVYSKALENFDSSVVKIIDTHDVLSNRYKLFLDKKLNPQWYSLFPKEESKGLSRADVIFAIQEKEQYYFQRISNTKVFVLGHLTSISHIESELSNSIVFVGSDNKINIDGINHFIKNIFPTIIKELNDVKLIIAGNILNRKLEVLDHANISFLGEYDSNAEIYALAKVVIVPITYGTGLKIKTIDALSCGKAVVSFDEGISGLEKPNINNPYCLLAKDDFDFSKKVLAILNDVELRIELNNNAIIFMQKYIKNTTQVLDKIFI
jgi:glycosyltransferase involved in cell wall biosynthesis